MWVLWRDIHWLKHIGQRRWRYSMKTRLLLLLWSSLLVPTTMTLRLRIGWVVYSIIILLCCCLELCLIHRMVTYRLLIWRQLVVLSKTIKLLLVRLKLHLWLRRLTIGRVTTMAPLMCGLLLLHDTLILPLSLNSTVVVLALSLNVVDILSRRLRLRRCIWKSMSRLLLLLIM